MQDNNNLREWRCPLPRLTSGYFMFTSCWNLTKFTSNLSSLTNGICMFWGCSKLTKFTSDLSNLTNGSYMFQNCSKLTSFSSDLPNLTNGEGMFSDCKLDTPSVQNIADTINTVTDKPLFSIGIGNTSPNDKEKAAFNKMVSKGWIVYVNGSEDSNIWTPTSLTPENGEEISTPIPFYAKPVPSDEETATYADEQGNYYNILGGQFIYGDDLSTYGMFVNEEDAAANMRLTKIEK